METKVVKLHNGHNSSEIVENEKENSGFPRKRLMIKMKSLKQNKKRKKNDSSDEDDIIFEELSSKKICHGSEEASSRILEESKNNSTNAVNISSPCSPSQSSPTVRSVKKTPESRNPITNFFSRIGAKKKNLSNGDSEAASSSAAGTRLQAPSLDSARDEAAANSTIDLEDDAEVVQISDEELQDDKEESREKKDVRTQNVRDKEKNFRQLNAGGKN